MKKLKMVFLNEEGKKATFTQANCHQALTGAQVKEVMEGISALKIIKKNGQMHFEQPTSANYTETIVTELF